MLNGIKEPHPALLKWAQQHTIECISAVVPVCPTCGSVHVVGDCHGKAGAAAIVAEDEEVKQKRITQSASRSPSPSTLRRADLRRRCQARNVTLEDAAEKWLREQENDE
jgi:hypothetical protein